MILTDQELKVVRQSLEGASGMDLELLRRCEALVHLGAFDEAVRNAFVLLEERLRDAANKDGMTGVALANYAFALDGPLAKQLGHSPSEREGLRELFSGAFKLFRNPAAHGTVGYDRAEGKGIISLVNLLLLILSRQKDLPAATAIPSRIEYALANAEKQLGAAAGSRLRRFIGKSIQMGLLPPANPKEWIPFKHYALVQYSHWPAPKPYKLSIFYLVSGKQIGFWFPVNQYYTNVKELNLGAVSKKLRGMEFQPTGKHQDFYIDLLTHNNQAFFDKVFDFLTELINELNNTLEHAPAKS